MEQYLDETPWDGLRFGALNPQSAGDLSNISWNHHRYDVAIGPDRTVVKRDGEVRFDANAGVVVRDYKSDSSGLSFTIKTPRPTNITTRELSSGSLSLTIDRQPSRTVAVQHGNVGFRLAAGDHRILETWK